MQSINLTLESLTTIISESQIITTETIGDLLTNNLIHPMHGNCVTIQGNESVGILIKN